MISHSKPLLKNYPLNSLPIPSSRNRSMNSSWWMLIFRTLPTAPALTAMKQAAVAEGSLLWYFLWTFALETQYWCVLRHGVNTADEFEFPSRRQWVLPGKNLRVLNSTASPAETRNKPFAPCFTNRQQVSDN